MAVTDEMEKIALAHRPHAACLVPERREEVTTEGGLDVASQESRVAQAVQQLGAAGSRVSLFIDPDLQQVEAAVRVGAPAIELHTGAYAEAHGAAAAAELTRLIRAAELGARLGLSVHAGHGLHYHNVQLVAAIPQIV